MKHKTIEQKTNQANRTFDLSSTNAAMQEAVSSPSILLCFAPTPFSTVLGCRGLFCVHNEQNMSSSRFVYFVKISFIKQCC